MEKKITSPLTKSIVISLILIVFSLVTYFMDLSEMKSLEYIGYVIFIAGVIWSVTSYGKQMDYNATFGKYFSHGFIVSAIVAAIILIFTIIFISVFPEMKEKGMEIARKRMEEKGNLSAEQISQGLEFTKKFFIIFAIIGVIVFYLLFGAIASLIGAAVTKKNPHPFTEGN